MIYIDTSAILKLYIKEVDSISVSEWIKKNNEPLPLTSLIELEFINALKLKHFRNEMTSDDFDKIILVFREHETRGVYFRPVIDWTDVYTQAFDLSKKYTGDIGSRSLDILHVASVLFLKIERILTFDERQARLSSLVGLKLEKY